MVFMVKVWIAEVDVSGPSRRIRQQATVARRREAHHPHCARHTDDERDVSPSRDKGDCVQNGLMFYGKKWRTGERAGVAKSQDIELMLR